MTSLRTANGRYSISVSGPTESRLENELKGRFCPERLRTRTSRISNSYPAFARASRRTRPTISTASSSFKWCSLMDSGAATHCTSPEQSFRTTKVVFPRTRMRHTQPRRATSCCRKLGRDSINTRYFVASRFPLLRPAGWQPPFQRNLSEGSVLFIEFLPFYHLGRQKRKH